MQEVGLQPTVSRASLLSGEPRSRERRPRGPAGPEQGAHVPCACAHRSARANTTPRRSSTACIYKHSKVIRAALSKVEAKLEEKRSADLTDDGDARRRAFCRLHGPRAPPPEPGRTRARPLSRL